MSIYENYTNGLSPKKYFGQVAILVSKIMDRHLMQLWIHSNNFFKNKILHNGRVQEAQENYTNGFFKKILGGSGSFWTQNWHIVITLEQL